MKRRAVALAVYRAWVARTYEETLRYELPYEATTMKAEALARQAIADAFSEALGELEGFASVETDGGYTSRGDDLDSALAELGEEGLKVIRTPVVFRPKGEYPMDAPSVTARPHAGELRVNVAWEDEGLVRTRAARVDRLVAPLLPPKTGKPMGIQIVLGPAEPPREPS